MSFPFQARLALEAGSLSRSRQLFVYFERIRAAHLAREEEFRAYVEEATHRITEIDLYLYELGQVYGSTLCARGASMLRLARYQDVSSIVLYTRCADEARQNADVILEFLGTLLVL